MLELDHIEMWCRGGEHKVDNLALPCRRHNQFAAEQKLGRDFMAKARESNRRIYPARGSFPLGEFLRFPFLP